MVFSHLPSNLLLIGVAFAPDLPTAITLLLSRFALSQMDVPARQAYVVAIVDPDERTAAAAYTNAARYVTRPLGPLLAGAAVRAGLGLPFLLAGTIKIVYDLGLYLGFRGVPLDDGDPPGTTPRVQIARLLPILTVTCGYSDRRCRRCRRRRRRRGCGLGLPGCRPL